MTDTVYKVLGPGRRPCHGGAGTWHPGQWRSVRGRLEPCGNGLHLCKLGHLLRWPGPEIWVAEFDGEMIECGDKLVVRRARIVERTPWDERTARLFAADCAERALPIFERAHPSDSRPREAVAAARALANGEIADATAAWAAAWAAERDARRDASCAAGDAARASARACSVWDSSRASLAWAVAWDAGQASARDSERASPAWVATLEWQTQRLGEYLRGEIG